MQRIVVDKKLDIFDYVVDFAIKQHHQKDRCGGPELWNIATRWYEIKFCGANGEAFRRFKAKFHREIDRQIGYCGAEILKWQKGNDEIKMSITYEYKKMDHINRKRKHLFVNYIVVNGEQVYKCQPCPPIEPKNVFWFEY